MHRKETVIAPLLETRLGVKTTVPSNFDTDLWGTFTRDRDRPGDPITTARIKAEQALIQTSETLAIASEGSFGPHPTIPFLASDREILLWLDREQNLEIIGEAISPQTNYRHRRVTAWADALDFAQQVGFPKHGLVVMADSQPQPGADIFKGITDETVLFHAVSHFLNQQGHAHLETDMRAMFNPTRMGVIAQATEDLLQKLQSPCPKCSTPGFAIAQYVPGLPCGWCSQPTPLPLAAIYQCDRCQYQHHHPYPHNQEIADPGQCAYCNP